MWYDVMPWTTRGNMVGPLGFATGVARLHVLCVSCKGCVLQEPKGTTTQELELHSPLRESLGCLVQADDYQTFKKTH